MGTEHLGVELWFSTSLIPQLLSGLIRTSAPETTCSRASHGLLIERSVSLGGRGPRGWGQSRYSWTPTL